VFESARVSADVEMGEKEGATTELDLKERVMRETYTDIRGIILARYSGYPEHLDDFNLDLDFPSKTNDRMVKVLDVVTVSDRHRAAGVPCVLPLEMTNRLSMVVEDVRTAYDSSNTERFESEHATHILNTLFDSDSIKLRELYSWARATWGRYDARFELIGMVAASQGGSGGGGGGEVPVAPTGFMFEWLEPVLQFTWDALESVTSYQIAFSEDGGVVWEELYTGADATFEYEPPEGMQYYRVRARNADGYGEWSAVIEYEIEGAPPMGEWPAELTGLYANYSDFPSPIIIVGHDGQAGADSFRLKRVKVSIADPDPTNADMPEENYVEGLNEDPFADSDIDPDDKCAYWACGVDAADVEGEWTGPVVGEYPA